MATVFGGRSSLYFWRVCVNYVPLQQLLLSLAPRDFEIRTAYLLDMQSGGSATALIYLLPNQTDTDKPYKTWSALTENQVTGAKVPPRPLACAVLKQ